LIFESTKYVPGEKHLLFKDSNKQLVDVKDKNTYEKWLGGDYIKIIEALGTSATCSGVAPFSPLPAILMAITVIIAIMFS
jgi:hypothetical protein